MKVDKVRAKNACPDFKIILSEEGNVNRAEKDMYLNLDQKYVFLVIPGSILAMKIKLVKIVFQGSSLHHLGSVSVKHAKQVGSSPTECSNVICALKASIKIK
jgi:hypothetical protein